MPVLVENTDFSARGYVAPTVYLKSGRYVSNWNYYSTLQGAINKFLFLKNLGGSNTQAVGIRSFVNDGSAQTFGINCDFYALVSGSWQIVSYAWLKSKISSLPPVVFRFMTVSGAGTYYAIFDPYYFGLSAISVGEVSPDKLAELDGFWREVQTMKYRYNSFVGFLNTLSQRELNIAEQKIFNQGLLMLNNLSNEMQTIRGIQISFQQGGKIGLPVLVIIVLIVVLSAAAAWAISSIAAERERTKRINDAYDLNKWVADKQIEVAKLAETGQISQQSAAAINKTLKDTAGVANSVAANAAKGGKTIFESLADVAKWGAIGFIGYAVFKKTQSKNGG